MKLDEIRKTTTCTDKECLKATFSFPHPASMYDPTDKRRNYVFVEVIKSSVEDTEVRISFDRFQIGFLDVMLAMRDENLILAMSKERMAGFVPLIQTPHESQLIYDHRHDEIPDGVEDSSSEE